LGIIVSCNTELVEYLLNHKLKIKYYFKPEYVWSSILIDISEDEETLIKSFSRSRRRNIKKAESFGLKSFLLEKREELDDIIDLYKKMCIFKKLAVDVNGIKNEFEKIYNSILNYKQGFILLIKEDDKIVGFIILVYQGNTVRSLKGATDPERRDIPIFPFGLFEAMKECKKNGFRYFDLWGYNHFTTNSNQVSKINDFKMEFGGEFIFFPKRMNLVINPILYFIYKLLKKSKIKSVQTIKKINVLLYNQYSKRILISRIK
jgi:lipid II:glycine glycyltransferase (peptidoglycan interpeptide bridge formation enzyme)